MTPVPEDPLAERGAAILATAQSWVARHPIGLTDPGTYAITAFANGYEQGRESVFAEQKKIARRLLGELAEDAAEVAAARAEEDADADEMSARLDAQDLAK